MTNSLKMHMTGNHISVTVDIWNKIADKYDFGLLVFDTGASVTIISEKILNYIGYDVTNSKSHKLITASGVEFAKEVILDRIRLGEFELENVTAYAHTFPEEIYTIGVIGLDILSQFDINILFSKRLIELTRVKEHNDESKKQCSPKKCCHRAV